MTKRFVSLVAVIILVAVAALAQAAVRYQSALYVKTLGIQATAVSVDVPSVGATACVTVTPTVANVYAGDAIIVAVPNSASTLTLRHQAVGTGSNVIVDKVCNPTNTTIDPSAQSYTFIPLRATY